MSQIKLSQEELAFAVGTTRQTITSIQVGKYTASLVLAYKIAHYFGLSIEEVFDFFTVPPLLITSLTMIFEGIIGGYFNIVIFYTLLAAGTCQMLLGICFKFYYLHKL